MHYSQCGGVLRTAVGFSHWCLDMYRCWATHVHFCWVQTHSSFYQWYAIPGIHTFVTHVCLWQLSLYGANQSKHVWVVCISNIMQSKVMQRYAESSNATQGHATSRKAIQRHAKFKASQVTHQLGRLYSPVATFRLYSGFFRRLGRGGCLPQVVSGI